MHAKAAQKPLRRATDETRAQKKRVGFHIQKPGDRAGGVVAVQSREHQVTGQGGAQGRLHRFVVADFADENDVGVLAHGGAEQLREGEADFFIDLRLANAGNLVFDGIFAGEDVVGRVADFGQCRVERRALAAPRGPRHQNHAVGFADHGPEQGQVVVGKAKVAEVFERRFAIQNSHDDSLPVVVGHGIDAKIDGPVGQLDRDAPILRQAILDDVHFRHDLDSRRNHGRQGLRDLADFEHLAVDAVAHFELLIARLDVNVGGSHSNRVAEDLVHQRDDREGFLFAVDDLALDLEHVARGFVVSKGLLDEVVDVVGANAALGVGFVDHAIDSLFVGHDRLDGQLHGVLNELDRVEIRGIPHRQDEAIGQ